MGLDLWFGEDVARILASTQETMKNAVGAVGGVEPERAAVYQEGFADALRAVAIAFGIGTPGGTVGWKQLRAQETASRQIVELEASPWHARRRP